MRNLLRPALTMVELILVIIILGIVASLGAEIIANVYEGYIIQRAQHRASIKTELAAIQIANRLAYAIPGTVVRKRTLVAEGTDINDKGNESDTILQWVGADVDSFNARSTASNLPGWSGFCDIDDSNTTSISTPGSNLDLVATIRTKLSLTNTGDPRIYFPSEDGLMTYTAKKVASSNTRIALSSPINTLKKKIVEHYKLATSSYALVADGDLTLYYNFAPIRDTAIGGSSKILLRNVSTFEFRGDGRTIRFKICVDERIGDGNITTCKEKAVF